MTTPLHKLPHQGVKWCWSSTEQAAFDKLNDTLSSDNVLGYYEAGLETRLLVDAGPNGLGLVLLQRKPEGWKAVECASRSLTVVPKWSPLIDREALAIRWARERCYLYLTGSSFVFETDHQPLLPLFNNPHSRPPMRIEPWLLYLQHVDFELKYCSGSKNAADYLTRHMILLTESDTKTCNAREQVVHSIFTGTALQAISLVEVQDATTRDQELSKLTPLIQAGNRNACKADPDLMKYAQVFQELSHLEGVVTRGHQIVIPKSLQERVIDIRHEGHLGVVKAKQLLSSRVWFPGIDKLVERKVASYIPCQASINTSQWDPLKMSPTPNDPSLEASADFYGPFPIREMFFVVLDAYSEYPEVEIVSSTAAGNTFPVLERIFATHGIQEVLKRDNGPPFQGRAFHEFAMEKGFHHRKITPLWPEANGHAENLMKNLGKVARTAHSQGKDWRRELYVFVANYRATPHPSTGKSPYKLCMNRTVRTKLPIIPKVNPFAEAMQEDQEAKALMNTYADFKRRTKSHSLNVGDHTLVKLRIQNKANPRFEPVPYTILDVKGSVIAAKRTTDQKLVTLNSSFFKKLANPLMEVIQESSPVPQVKLQAPLDFDGPECIEHT